MTEAKLIETEIEERDGAVWITGLCPFCWDRVGAQGPAPALPPATVQCPNGHTLQIVELRSAGATRSGAAEGRTRR